MSLSNFYKQQTVNVDISVNSDKILWHIFSIRASIRIRYTEIYQKVGCSNVIRSQQSTHECLKIFGNLVSNSN